MKTSLEVRVTRLLLILLLCAGMFSVGVFVGYGGKAQPSAVSASVYRFQGLDGAQEIDLGFLREGQRLTCEVQIGRGSVELWVEDAAGERVPDTVSHQLAVPESGDYRLWVSGKDAAFSIAALIEEP